MEAYGRLSRGEFAARIRAARAYLDWRLDEAGPKLGISRQALSRRESGAVNVRIPDRYLMAMVYCEATGWPRTFFTDEVVAPFGITSRDTGGGEVEPGDVAHLVSEPPDSAALP